MLQTLKSLFLSFLFVATSCFSLTANAQVASYEALVKQLGGGGDAPPNLIGYWRLSDLGKDNVSRNADKDIVDYSGHSLDGVGTGDLALGQTGQVCGDTAIGFTDINNEDKEYVNIDLEPINIRAISNWSLSFWARIEGGSNEQTLVELIRSDSQEQKFAIKRNASRIGFNIFGRSLHRSSAKKLDEFKWHQITIVRYETITRTPYTAIYVDGVCEIGNLPGCSTSTSTTLPPLEPRNNLIRIGGSLGNGFSGLMDEVALFSRVLTQPEIQQMADFENCGLYTEDFILSTARATNNAVGMWKIFQSDIWGYNVNSDQLDMQIRGLEFCDSNGGCDINAVHKLDNGRYLVSFNSSTWLRNHFDPDIRAFPHEIYELNFDGSNSHTSNLTLTKVFPNSSFPGNIAFEHKANIDAITVHPTRGTLMISTTEPEKLLSDFGSFSFGDGDVVEINLWAMAPLPWVAGEIRLFEPLSFDWVISGGCSDKYGLPGAPGSQFYERCNYPFGGSNEDITGLHIMHDPTGVQPEGNAIFSLNNKSGGQYVGKLYFRDGDLIEYNFHPVTVNKLGRQTARRVLTEEEEFGGNRLNIDGVGEGRFLLQLDPDLQIAAENNTGIHCGYETVTISAVDPGSGSLDGSYSAQVQFRVEDANGHPVSTASIAIDPGSVAEEDNFTGPDRAGYYRYTFVPEDGGDAAFRLIYPEGPSPLNVEVISVSDPGERDTTEAITFYPHGFLLTEEPVVNSSGKLMPAASMPSTTIQTRVAGRAYGAGDPLYLTAVAKGAASGDECNVITDFNDDKPITVRLAPKNLDFASQAYPAVEQASYEQFGSSAYKINPQPIMVNFTNGIGTIDATHNNVGAYHLIISQNADDAGNALADDQFTQAPFFGINAGIYSFSTLVFRPAEFSIETVDGASAVIGSGGQTVFSNGPAAADTSCVSDEAFGCAVEDDYAGSLQNLLNTMPRRSAGHNINITVTALGEDGQALTNFGKETGDTADRYTIDLQPELVLPAGGTGPSGAGSLLSQQLSFIDGVATARFSYDNVGVMKISPRLGAVSTSAGVESFVASDYFGSGLYSAYRDPSGEDNDGPSGYLVFQPYGYQIDTASSSVTPKGDCLSSRPFLYAGEALDADIRVKALAGPSTVASNYTGIFSTFNQDSLKVLEIKGETINPPYPNDDPTGDDISTASTITVEFEEAGASGDFLIPFNVNDCNRTGWSADEINDCIANVVAGSATFRLNRIVEKGDTPRLAMDATVKISDAVASDLYNAPAVLEDGTIIPGKGVPIYGSKGDGSIGDTCDNDEECEIGDSQELRWGRLQLTNAYGSDLEELHIPWEIQYYSSILPNGSVGAWVRSEADTCGLPDLPSESSMDEDGCADVSASTFAAVADLDPDSIGPWEPGPNASDSKCRDGYNMVKSNIRVCRGPDGEAYRGTFNLGRSGGDCRIHVPVSYQLSDLLDPSDPIGEHYLEYGWSGGDPENPSAEATFGIYNAGRRKIFMRELY